MNVAAFKERAHDFARDKDGRILPASIDNVRLALAKLEASVSLNEFSRDILVNGHAFNDRTLNRLWVSCDDEFRFRPSKDLLKTVVETEADRRPVHPVRDYLNALSWDGRPRLDTWLTTYAAAADDAYVRAVGALTLIAAVRRVRRPGCKFDELLILESAQGTGKSSGLRALCPDEDWFSDDLPLGVDSKIVIERTTGRWLIEAAELHGNRGRETETLKAFLSRQVDGPVRLAYDRIPTTVPRQFVIIGTTNLRHAYLKDMTGARRFWPVSIDAFDVQSLARDRDQLWAEAATREADGESIRLDASLWCAAAEQQEDRRAADPWEAILEPLLDGDGVVAVEHVPVSEIWNALKLEKGHLDNRHADRVAIIAQRHGFTRKKRIRVNGQPQLCWVKGGSDAS